MATTFLTSSTRLGLLVTIATALTLGSLPRAESLFCYACSSLNDPNCWNVAKLSTGNVQECEDMYFSCMTRVTTMDNVTFIGRNCMPKSVCENTVNVQGVIEDRCQTCQTDFCNLGVTGKAARVHWGSVAPLGALIMLLMDRFTAIRVN